MTHALLRAAVPMRCVPAGCKPAKQERRTKSTNGRTALATDSLVHVLHHPKVLRSHHVFAILKCKSSSHHGPVHFLSTTFPDRGTLLRKQRPYFGDPEATLPVKTGFCARKRFHPWIHALRTPLLVPHANCSCSLSCLLAWWTHDDVTMV